LTSQAEQYWNLRANPDTAIEVGDETIAVRVTELTGATPRHLTRAHEPQGAVQP